MDSISEIHNNKLKCYKKKLSFALEPKINFFEFLKDFLKLITDEKLDELT